MKLPILEVPDPRLWQKAAPIETVDAKILQLMEEMLETMYAAPGIGLAAPQVGVLKRMVVVDVSREDNKAFTPLRMVNPKLLWASIEQSLCEEGCLSVPNQYAEVSRPSRIRVRYLDHQNECRDLEAYGVLATAIQHEIDHLDGVLFIDYLSKLKRDIIVRRVQKARRSR